MDAFIFSEEESPSAADSTIRPWRILIVDDEPDVHFATQLALAGVTIKGRSIELTSAHSGQEGLEQLKASQDFDLMLLDAVMETERAGMRLACSTRLDLQMVGVPIIVLRSGYAGHEIERNISGFPCIDEFLHKSQSTRPRLIEILERWLGTVRGTNRCESCNADCPYKFP